MNQLSWILVVVTATAVSGVANGIAAQGSERTTDGGAFETTTALRSDDAADSGTAKPANDSSLLGPWSACAG